MQGNCFERDKFKNKIFVPKKIKLHRKTLYRDCTRVIIVPVLELKK